MITWAIWVGFGAGSGHSGEAHPYGCICQAGLECSKDGKVEAKKGLPKGWTFPLEWFRSTAPATWMAGASRPGTLPHKSGCLHQDSFFRAWSGRVGEGQKPSTLLSAPSQAAFFPVHCQNNLTTPVWLQPSWTGETCSLLERTGLGKGSFSWYNPSYRAQDGLVKNKLRFPGI